MEQEQLLGEKERLLKEKQELAARKAEIMSQQSDTDEEYQEVDNVRIEDDTEQENNAQKQDRVNRAAVKEGDEPVATFATRTQEQNPYEEQHQQQQQQYFNTCAPDYNRYVPYTPYSTQAHNPQADVITTLAR